MNQNNQLNKLNEKLKKLFLRKTNLQQNVQEFNSKYGTKNSKLTPSQLNKKNELKNKYNLINAKIVEKRAEMKAMKKVGGGIISKRVDGRMHGRAPLSNGSTTAKSMYGVNLQGESISSNKQSPTQSPQPTQSQQQPQNTNAQSSPQSPQPPHHTNAISNANANKKSQQQNNAKCLNSNKSLANNHLPIMVLTDSYKLGHPQMYPSNATRMVAYGEFRGPMAIDKKLIGDERIVVMGLEYIIKNYINRTWCQTDLDNAKKFFLTHAPNKTKYQFPEKEFKAIVKDYNGKIPIEVHGLPDGSVVLPHTPIYKIIAEQKREFNFSKLITFFETILTMVWYPSCVATLSRNCKQIIEDAYIDTGLANDYDEKGVLQVKDAKYNETLQLTGMDLDDVIRISMHDFGFRGATTVEQSVLGGMAHLLNFDGTDTMSAAYQTLKEANMLDTQESIGVSIPATEHSVMTSFDTEENAILNMFNNYIDPINPITKANDRFSIFAMVMDSYDYTKASFKELPNAIMKYDREFEFGTPTLHVKTTTNSSLTNINNSTTNYNLYKVVLRPDSGEPVEVVLLGLVAACAIFGFKTYFVNKKTYLQCNNSGVIQGDGINVFTLKKILQQLTGTGDYTSLNLATGLNITKETDTTIENKAGISLTDYLTTYIMSSTERFKNATTDKTQVDASLKTQVDEVLRLLKNGAHFTPDCMAFGMGGGLIQKVNRDTMKFATKLCSSTQNDKKVIVMKNPATDPGKRSIPGEMDVIDNSTTSNTSKTNKLPFQVISKEDLRNRIDISDGIIKTEETGKSSKMTLIYNYNGLLNINSTISNNSDSFLQKRTKVNKEWYLLKQFIDLKKNYFKKLKSNAENILINVNKTKYRKQNIDKMNSTNQPPDYSYYFTHLTIDTDKYDGTQKPHFSEKLNWMQQFYDPSKKQFVVK